MIDNSLNLFSKEKIDISFIKQKPEKEIMEHNIWVTKNEDCTKKCLITIKLFLLDKINYENENDKHYYLFRIIDRNNPMFLYNLEIDKKYYAIIKNSQHFRQDFENFPYEVLEPLLNKCSESFQNAKNNKTITSSFLDNDEKYFAMLEIVDGKCSFIIKSQTRIKETAMLTLELKKPDNVTLLNYVSGCNVLLKQSERELTERIKGNEIIIEKFKSENNLLNNKIAELSNKIKISEDNITLKYDKKMQDETNNYTTTVNNLKRQLLELEDNSQNKYNNMQESLKKNIEQLKNENEELSAKLYELKRDFNSQQNAVNILENEIKIKDVEFKKVKECNITDQSKLYDLDKKVVELRKECEGITALLNDKKDTITKLEVNINSQKAEIKDKDTEIFELKSKIEKLNSKLKLSIEEIHKANNYVEYMKTDFVSRIKKYKSFQATNKSLEEEISQYRHKIDSLNRNINDLKLDNDNRNNDIKMLENKNKKLQKELADSKIIIERGEDQIRHLHQRLNEQENPLKNKKYNYEFNNNDTSNNNYLSRNISNTLNNNFKYQYNNDYKSDYSNNKISDIYSKYNRDNYKSNYIETKEEAVTINKDISKEYKLSINTDNININSITESEANFKSKSNFEFEDKLNRNTNNSITESVLLKHKINKPTFDMPLEYMNN